MWTDLRNIWLYVQCTGVNLNNLPDWGPNIAATPDLSKWQAATGHSYISIILSLSSPSYLSCRCGRDRWPGPSLSVWRAWSWGECPDCWWFPHIVWRLSQASHPLPAFGHWYRKDRLKGTSKKGKYFSLFSLPILIIPGRLWMLATRLNIKNDINP